MRNVLRASALVVSAVAFSLFSSGCDGAPSVVPDPDAGVAIDGGSITDDAATEDAGPLVRPDGGTPGRDAGEPCSADWECEDWDACTSDACVAGACSYAAIPDCEGCRSDAECSDGNPSTQDVCDTWTRSCSHMPMGPCGSPADCDDGNPCTDDQCSPGTGFCAWGSVPDCCFRDSDCADYDDCTADSCGADHACGHDRIPGCGSSACDFDRDGHGSVYCYPAGDDCDDMNPAVHGGATEVCDNGIDDDCDGLRDGADEACAPTNTTCAAAIPFTGTTSTTGAVVSAPGGSGASCGAPTFWTLALAETSDVTLHVRIHDFPPEPPPCPGCPPPDSPMQINYNVFLESTCGDTSTDLGGAAGGCYYWSPGGGGPFTGSQEVTRTLRRLAPGAYAIEVQASEMFGWRTLAIEFDLDVTVTASAAPECGAPIVLTDGAPRITGSTASHADAFGLDCRGGAVESPEVVHSFTLADRRRVRIAAQGIAPAGSTYTPSIRLGLLGTCNADAERLACVEGASGTSDSDAAAILEPVLDAGTYFLTLERGDGSSTEYSLSYATEAPGAACAGALAIAGSGSTSGTTAGGVDRFRWNGAGCGAGAAPDVVYTLAIAAPSRVVLDLIASYSGPILRVVSGCGARQVAGSVTRTRIDTTLEAGTYEVIVDGARTTDAGSFVLNTTILPI